MTTLPYGSWPSPISSGDVAAGGVSFGGLATGELGLYWLEGRPLEGGRSVVVRHAADGRTGDVTPEGFNVRTRVHEYGGGAWLVAGSTVFFSNFADQRLYRQDGAQQPRPITPEPATPSGVRYADMRLTPDGRLLLCVRETHAGDSVVNELVVVDPDGSGGEGELVSGRDFFSSPRPSPDGTRLAWVCWDHPNMPWDTTELWVARLLPDGGLREPTLVAGGDGESVIHPVWSPDGTLHYLSDRTGWWNPYDEHSRALVQIDAEIGGPQWSFGHSYLVFLDDGRPAYVYSSRGRDHLAVLDEGAVLDLAAGYTSIGSLCTDGTSLYAIAASASTPATIVRIDPDDGSARQIARSRMSVPSPSLLPEPEAIEFPTTAGRTSHALYYAPANAECEGPPDERPPLLVFSHGGPTGATSSALNMGIRFFTSRGLAVVDVNYGGSTGYGREYRERLQGTWGVTDVEDCAAAARFLAQRGDVDGTRVAIRGGSAGGYTTLCSLVFTDDYACGASYYGVADAETLARDTHKFESRYLDGLIGPYPEAAGLYRERSPIHHVERLSAPVIFFQGLEDRVVPPSQAEEMVAALDAKGIPHAYLAFEGEQHGFRRAETVERTLLAELSFYGRILGFQPAGDGEVVQIRHLTS